MIYWGDKQVKVKKIQKKKYQAKQKRKSGFNNEIAGILLIAFGILTLLSFYFNNSIGDFGRGIRSFLFGAIGLPAFIIPPLIIVYAFFILFNKSSDELKLRSIYGIILIVLSSALIQVANYHPENYKNLNVIRIIGKFFEEINAEGVLFDGGVIGRLLSTPLLTAFQPLGTIIILTALCVIDIILLTNISVVNFIRNVRTIGANKSKKPLAVKSIKKNEYVQEDDMEIVGDNDNLSLAFKPKNKIIDFKIEKTSRELKEKTDKPVETGFEELPQEFLQDIPQELPMEEIEPKVRRKSNVKEMNKIKEDVQKEIASAETENSDYLFPPIDLLIGAQDDGKRLKQAKNSSVEVAKKLEDTLKSFGVDARVINVSKGPAVTRFELQPSPGVKVSKIVNLSDDISLNLAASGVRIEAPIPGKAAIGIEVPNKEMTAVLLKEVIESPEFTRFPSKLAFSVGKDISGENVVADIAKMPHLLIAGATGAGKSVCINSLIISLLYKASPDEVKLLMIDPKVVELGIYNGIPHLLIPVVTEPKKAAGALNWAVQEMVNRYKLFADKGVRDIKGYNAHIKEESGIGLLPQIVIIIDELADLMMVAPNDVEDAICRLAQMARAAGMHLVIATQRPSVDVITGIIKANIPSRISFAVSSQVDSRTILDMAGAEKLLGKGDMLFYPVGEPKPIRVKGCFVSEKEVERVVEHIKSIGQTEYDNNIIEEINSEKEPEEKDSGDNDELLPLAIGVVVEAGQASSSLIQRKFKVGYARAARIIDQMEARGIVGGFEGSKPRQVLISKQQWQEMQTADMK